MSHQASSKFTIKTQQIVNKHIRLNRDGSIAGTADLDFGVTRAYAKANTNVAVTGLNAPGSVSMIAAPGSVIVDGEEVYSAPDGMISNVKGGGAYLRGIAMSNAGPGDIVEILNFAEVADYITTFGLSSALQGLIVLPSEGRAPLFVSPDGLLTGGTNFDNRQSFDSVDSVLIDYSHTGRQPILTVFTTDVHGNEHETFPVLSYNEYARTVLVSFGSTVESGSIVIN